MLLFFNEFLEILRESWDFGIIDIRTMSAIILRKSFSTEFGENTAHFLNFKTTRSLIKFLSPSRKLRPDARPYWRFESFFLIYRRRQPREKKERSRGPAGAREEKWKKKEENGKSWPAGCWLNVLNNGKIYQMTPTVFP